MSASAYQQALDQIGLPLRTGIEAGIALLDGQLQANIGNETALAVNDFVDVLRLFSDTCVKSTVMNATTAFDAWQTACWAHSRRGKVVPDAHLPIVLGRCKTLAAHASDLFSIPDSDFNVDEAENLLRTHSKSNNPVGFVDSLREALLGKYTLWATFDETDTTKNPFLRLPQTHAGICAALGLQISEAIVVLAWNHLVSGAPPLHRPTIADAAENTLFRPHHDAASHYGYTGPLTHIPALDPQPEVVLDKITCKGLILPYIVFDV
jgi:hypothetical protein